MTGMVEILPVGRDDLGAPLVGDYGLPQRPRALRNDYNFTLRFVGNGLDRSVQKLRIATSGGMWSGAPYASSQ